MFDPKSPLAAAAIFTAGIAIIGYTILDVNRSLQQNSEPVTQEQQAALNSQFRESGRNVAGGAQQHVDILWSMIYGNKYHTTCFLAVSALDSLADSSKS